MPRRDEWTDDEIILALAACPRDKQRYSPRHKNVIELADLIGRTTGAVSHHFANISHLIHGGTQGETHVGSRTRELFDEYRGREAELHTRASKIRRRLLSGDLTPRVEKRVVREEAHQLTVDVLEGAKEAGLPEDGLETYEREGSWYLGVIVNLAIVLVEYRGQTTRFLEWLARKLGSAFSRSRGFDLALEGKWQSIADDIVEREAPELHSAELRPVDRVTLALRIPQIGTLRRWKPTKKHVESLTRMNREDERKRVNAYLGIDSSGVCDACLLMLKDLVDRSIKRGRKTRH